MTFPIFGSECAPGIVDSRPSDTLDVLSCNAAAIDLIGLFGLDRLPLDRRLVCRWHRQIDGRLACSWEPDISPIPQR